MEKLTNKYLMPMAQFIAANRYMIALKNGMVKITPLTIIGSIFLILSQLPKIISFIPDYSESVYQILNFPYTITYGILGLVAVGAVAYSLAQQDKDLDPYMNSISAMLIFVTLCAPIEGGMMNAAFLGSQGIFAAILVGLATPMMISFFTKKNIKIKMPDSVPPYITSSFESIIPTAIALVIFYGLSVLCQSMTGGLLIPAFINKLLAPAITGVDSIWFVVTIMFFVQILFFFGLHGASILFGFITPFAIANTALNAEAIAQGGSPTKAFTFVCLYLGGYFYSIWAILLMRCKSERLRSIGKIALVPAIFNIQEPLQYGAPIMLNPLLFIPYIVTNAIGVGLTYWVMDVGLVNCAAVGVPSILPQPFMGLLATLDWRSVVLWAVLVLINYIIWKPFIHAYDQQVLAEDGK